MPAIQTSSLTNSNKQATAGNSITDSILIASLPCRPDHRGHMLYTNHAQGKLSPTLEHTTNVNTKKYNSIIERKSNLLCRVPTGGKPMIRKHVKCHSYEQCASGPRGPSDMNDTMSDELNEYVVLRIEKNLKIMRVFVPHQTYHVFNKSRVFINLSLTFFLRRSDTSVARIDCGRYYRIACSLLARKEMLTTLSHCARPPHLLVVFQQRVHDGSGSDMGGNYYKVTVNCNMNHAAAFGRHSRSVLVNTHGAGVQPTHTQTTRPGTWPSGTGGQKQGGSGFDDVVRTFRAACYAEFHPTKPP